MTVHEADARLIVARAERQRSTSAVYFVDASPNPPRLFSEVQWLSAAANRERRDGAGWTQAVTLEGDSAVVRRIENRREVSRRALRFYLDVPELEIAEPPPAPSLDIAAAVTTTTQQAAAARLREINAALERRPYSARRAAPTRLPWALIIVTLICGACLAFAAARILRSLS